MDFTGGDESQIARPHEMLTNDRVAITNHIRRQSLLEKTGHGNYNAAHRLRALSIFVSFFSEEMPRSNPKVSASRIWQT